MKVVSFVSFKGGVGKSTIALNFATELSNYHSVLLVDTDPQNSLAFFLCKGFERGFSEVLFENLYPEEAIYRSISGRGTLNFLPAGVFCLKKQIFYEEKFQTELLEKFLQSNVIKEHDFIVFDSPPRLNRLIESLLYVSDEALLISTPDPASYSSISVFLKFFEDRNYINKLFAIVNMIKPSKVADDFVRVLKYVFGDKLLGIIPEDLVVQESQGKCIPTVIYDPDTPFSVFTKKAVLNYLKLVSV